MAEYLAPGVYVEEIGRGPAPIEGVSTSTAAFLGPTERGPTAATAVSSFSEYLRLFGGAFTDAGYMFHAVQGFFENGGREAVIVRIVAAAGGAPVAEDYAGGADGEASTGLAALDAPEQAHVALVYAPDACAVADLVPRLMAHCELSRYRFAVLDAPAEVTVPIRPADSSFAACYHPWIEVADPRGGGATRRVPPGGHVLGVYARVDTERGVFKAPANEQLSGAVGLAVDVTSAGQEALKAAGVNVIRRFAGRGILVWGARTLSADPAWKYVNVRRLFIYLERSIERGTRWAVFEPNDERLWARVQDTVRLFLREQWRSGVFPGQKEEEAFFVRCDRSTMTQDDLDNGRLVCLVGLAPVRPAEFAIFRIGQWTADRDPPG